MGRKTNSNSLRIKKTNKDYLSCWYGDLLYSQIFEKSFTIQNCIIAILKTNGVSVPQISNSCGFKKHSILLCYLDPNSRKSFSESLNFKNKNDWPSPIDFRYGKLETLLKNNINFENIILTKSYKKSFFLSFYEENRLLAKPELSFKESSQISIDSNYKNKNLLPNKKNQNVPKIVKESQKKTFEKKTFFWHTNEREKQNLKNLRIYFFKILFFPLVCGFRNNLFLYKNRDISYKKRKVKDFYKSSINKKIGYNLESNNFFISFLKPLVLKNVEKDKNQTIIPNFYKNLSNFWENVYYVYFIRTLNEKANSLFLAHYISYFLERKVSFRRIKRQIFQNISKSSKKKNANSFSFFILERFRSIRGVRISCKGRVGGRSKKAQRSRKETFIWGETGLHVFSNKLDFAKTNAETSFGLVGVQVWICIK